MRETLTLNISIIPKAMITSRSGPCGHATALSDVSGLDQSIHPGSLSITHISDGAFALSESFVILFVTPIRGGVTDERGEGIQYIRLA